MAEAPSLPPGAALAVLAASWPWPLPPGAVLVPERVTLAPHRRLAAQHPGLMGAELESLGLPEALRRLDSAVIAVWFPVKRQRDVDLWLAKVARVITQPTLVAQLWLHPRDIGAGLNGSGLLIVNPPWQIDTRLAVWQEELRQRLGGDSNSGSDVRWIIHE